jgi:hypothetical protein
MIKVFENNKISQIANSKARKSDKSADNFANYLDTIDSTEPTTHTANISDLNMLLALQGVEDQNSNKQAKQYGQDLLTSLDKLKLALLSGELMSDQLDKLTNIIQNHKKTVLDPKLNAILGEIELRAAVEITKLQKIKNELF